MNQATSPDEMIGVGIFGACCFLIGAAGFIGVIIWMLRNRAAAATSTTLPPPVAVQSPTAADFHLSVIALAFDGYFRPQVAAALATASSTTDPVAARVELVQRAARALLGVEAQWRHFGYGEKELNSLPETQQSYTNALTDFRTRATRPEDGGVLAVLTIVLATRGRRLGVDRLDTRAQVHELLTDRLNLDAGALLGAEVVWAPQSGGLTEPAIRERYPEMHSLAL
jgi:uncharacterized membrane protein